MPKHQSKIEKLIAEHCPKGVEFKKLGEVCEIADNKRKPVASSLRVAGKIPYYGANNIQDYVEGFTHEGDYVLIAEDGSASLENYSIQFASGKFWANNHVHVVRGRNELNNKFLFHYLRSMNFVPYLTGGTRAKLTKGKMLEIKIPLPPLDIQQEVAKILDTFTKLEAELEAELEARKKQYEHYRSELLTFKDGTERERERVRWAALSEVCLSITAGGDLPENYMKGQNIKNKEFPYPIYSNGSNEKALYGYADSYKVDSESVTISARGTIGFHAVRSPKFTPIVRLITLIPDVKTITAKFLNYILDITEISHSGGSIPQLIVPDVKKIKIPVPSLTEQERIVSVLDKFNALVNDISIGLPAELSARRFQYEYYRGKLLTFNEYAPA